MAALLESMFFVGREKPWHGQGVSVESAPTSEDAIRLAGLDWDVVQQPIYLGNGSQIPDNFANVRSTDGKFLGVVGNRYQIVQNRDAFSFTDALLGEGVTYETAGSLKDGKTVWMLARMPETVEILGDEIMPYLVFTNTHDGSGAIRVAAVNIRIVCNNTLNLALKQAKRVWSARHTGSIESKLDDAMQTLQLAHKYLDATKETMEDLYKVKLSDITLYSTIKKIIPIGEDLSDRQRANLQRISDDILYRYNNAPDLINLDRTGARLVQAVADTTSHIEPVRRTANYEENHFKSMLDGNDLLDRTVGLLLSA